MPNGNVAATPDMVNQLSGSEEVELNPQTGEVKPLPSQNSADPSQTASPEGATAEPVSNAAETPVQSPEATPPSSTPASAQSAPSPVVTVTPTVQPAPAVATEPAPAPVQTEAPKEDMADALKVLAEYRDTTIEEARRSVQSAHDKQNAQVTRQLEDANTRSKELTTQMRELQTRDLTDAERATVMAKFDQDDERDVLNTSRAELLVLQKSVYVDSLLMEFADYGVTRDAIEAIETPEEMELFCTQQKSSHFETKLRETPTQEGTPAPAPALVAATAPVEPTSAPVPNVPAGAFATSDVGGGGTVPESKKFSEEATPDAMRENLRNMDRVSVGIKQG